MSQQYQTKSRLKFTEKVSVKMEAAVTKCTKIADALGLFFLGLPAGSQRENNVTKNAFNFSLRGN